MINHKKEFVKEIEKGLDDTPIFEISELIACYLGGELTPIQQARLDEWLAEDVKHQELFDSICSKSTIHSKFRTYRQDDSQAAYLKFVHHRRRTNKTPRMFRILITSAAVIALLFGGWMWQRKPVQNVPLQTQLVEITKIDHPNKPLLKLYTGEEFIVDSSGFIADHTDGRLIGGADGQTQSEVELETVFNELVVPTKCDFQFTMSDGTKVWMNANSTLRYPVTFAKNERSIYVTGEIYLEVAKDAKRPFYVELDGMRISVLGTSFNVRAYPDEIEKSVALLEGKVKATILSKDYDLKPGKQLSLDSELGGVNIKNVDVNDITAWTRGYYVFQKSSLASVAPTLQNWYDIEIVFNTQKSREREYTGVINKNEPIEVFMNRLEQVSSSRCVKKENKLYIY